MKARADGPTRRAWGLSGKAKHPRCAASMGKGRGGVGKSCGPRRAWALAPAARALEGWPLCRARAAAPHTPQGSRRPRPSPSPRACGALTNGSFIVKKPADGTATQRGRRRVCADSSSLCDAGHATTDHQPARSGLRGSHRKNPHCGAPARTITACAAPSSRLYPAADYKAHSPSTLLYRSSSAAYLVRCARSTPDISSRFAFARL